MKKMRRKNYSVYLLLLGFIVSNVAIAQDYMHVKETSGLITDYTISDVQKMTFTSTDLNVKSTSGVIVPYTLNDALRVTFDNSSTVGIDEVDASITVGVHPNPTSGVFTLGVNNVKTSEFTVNIYNVTGALLSSVSYTQNQGVVNEKIDLSKYGEGIYFLKINSDNKVITKKIIVN